MTTRSVGDVILRPAARGDVAAVVAMAHDLRRAFAEWSPLYFRPRAGAAEMHPAYLEFLIGSADHRTDVFADGDDVAGFFAVVEQPAHHWVDDLLVADVARWPEVARLLASAVDPPWVTCVSRFDLDRAHALAAVGLDVASTYWARSLDGVEPIEPIEPNDSPHDAPNAKAPRHTFGGRPLDPATPGALVIDDGMGGSVIGSPSMRPPLFDPGGSACVIDQIVGADRGALLRTAMSAATARGDAAMVVVCGHDDHELHGVLDDLRFRAEVDLFATP